MKTARPFGREYRRVLRRGLTWQKYRGFTCRELFVEGLLHPKFRSEQIDCFLSKRETIVIQRMLNPSHCSSLLKNKILMYKHLAAATLPHPEVLAVFDKTTAGVSSNHRILTTRQDWIDYIQTDVPDEFFIKPAYGTTGLGVKHFRKDGDRLTDGKESVGISQVYDDMKNYPDSPAYLIQRRIKNHPAIVEFTGKHMLQTMRIVTYVNRHFQPEILFTAFKFILGEAVVDNFRRGEINNTYAFIDAASGRIDLCVLKHKNGQPADLVALHPVTQKPFRDFNIPFWSESLEAARQAAVQFLPIRCVGWDIAITEQGPSIIEGNIWWDPYNRLAYKQRILEDLGCDPLQIRLTQKRRPDLSDCDV